MGYIFAMDNRAFLFAFLYVAQLIYVGKGTEESSWQRRKSNDLTTFICSAVAQIHDLARRKIFWAFFLFNIWFFSRDSLLTNGIFYFLKVFHVM